MDTCNASWAHVHLCAASGYIDGLRALPAPDIYKLTSLGETAMHLAAVSGETETLSYLMNKYPRMLGLHTTNNETVLQTAIKARQTGIIAMLVKNQIFWSANLDTVWDTLAFAVVHDSLFVFEVIAKNHPEALTCVDRQGNTLLHVAVMNKKLGPATIATLTFLLNDVPKHLIAATNRMGDTALHLAVRRKSLEMVDLLFSADSSAIAIPNVWDETPLLAGLEHSPINDYFLSRCPFFEQQTKQPEKQALPILQSPHASWSKVHICASIGCLEKISWMEDPDVHKLTEYGETAIHIAAACGQLKVLRYLLQKFPGLYEYRQETVLKQTIASRQKDVLQLLLAHPSLSNMPQVVHASIRAAIENNYLDGVKMLLQYYPEAITCVDHHKKTLLHCAVTNNRQEILTYVLTIASSALVSATDRDRCTALYTAVAAGVLDLVKLLYKAQPSMIDIPDSDGLTPFLRAAHAAHTHILEYFISQHPTAVNQITQTKLSYLCKNIKVARQLVTAKPQLINQVDSAGNTVLHFQTGDEETVRFLMQTRPNLLYVTNHEHRTPLHAAFSASNQDRVCSILNFKPDFVDTSYNGPTALHIATLFCTIDVFERVLLSHPSNVNCRDSKGNTPFDIALKNRKDAAQVKLFLPHINVETVVVEHDFCEKQFQINLQAVFLQHAASVNNYLLPELATYVYVFLGILNTTKKQTPKNTT